MLSPACDRQGRHLLVRKFQMKRALVTGLLGAALFLFAGALVSPLGSWLSAQSGQPLGAPDPAIQLSDRFETIAGRILPAVVSVEAVKPPKASSGKSKPVEESGSGVLVKID